jgi:branched-chain amino acid transport system substrate-binding protein
MARRRLLGAVALAATVSLTAAACGSSGGSSSSGPVTYTIGFQGPLSGDNSQLGINGVDGIKVAIAEANAKNLGFKLKLVQADDQGDPSKAPTAAQKLAQDPTVLAVVGPMFSGATKASEPIFTAAGLVSVSPSATNPTLTTLGFKTFYRVIATDAGQGKAAANYMAKGLKASSVFSLDDTSEYGTGLSKVIETTLTTDGVKFTHDSIAPTKDYTAEATKIIASGAPVLYYSGYYSDFALLSKALRTAGYKGTIMSGDGSLDNQYIAQAGAANAEGALITCPCLLATADPNAAAFVKEYEADNPGQTPGTYSAEAYDAANAIISVLTKEGTKASRAAVAADFGSIDFQGLTKEVKFTPTGEVTTASFYVYKVVNGQITVVGDIAKLIGS